MNCPHCNKELAENYAQVYCPACGRDITLEQTPTVASPKTDWPVFYVALFAPAVLSFIGIALNIVAVTVIATFGGSLVAGKMCSSLLAEKREMSAAAQWLAGGALAVLSFILCFGGCIAGSVIGRH